MDEIQQSSKEEIYDLVSSQKKAKLDWISTITKIPIEDIIVYAEELGLVINGDFIALPTPQKEESTVISMETEYTPLKPKMEIKEKKSGLFFTLGFFMVFISIIFIIIPIYLMLDVMPTTCPWFITFCLAVILLGLVIGYFGIRFFIRLFRG